jgi:hypothetical protein
LVLLNVFVGSFSGQKIVGFSFYGDVKSSVAIEKGYFDGIVGNLKLMPTFYPGN